MLFWILCWTLCCTVVVHFNSQKPCWWSATWCSLSIDTIFYVFEVYICIQIFAYFYLYWLNIKEIIFKSKHLFCWNSSLSFVRAFLYSKLQFITAKVINQERYTLLPTIVDNVGVFVCFAQFWHRGFFYYMWNLFVLSLYFFKGYILSEQSFLLNFKNF